MKMPNKLLLGALGLALVAAPVSGDIDLSSLYNQVQHQQSQVNNHEARITNNEKDIKNLQDNTNTPPASDPVAVPQVDSTTSATSTAAIGSTAPTQASASVATPTPAPNPTVKKVVAVDHASDPNYSGITPVDTCKYTFDDGSIGYQRIFNTNPDGTPVACKLAVGDSVPL